MEVALSVITAAMPILWLLFREVVETCVTWTGKQTVG